MFIQCCSHLQICPSVCHLSTFFSWCHWNIAATFIQSKPLRFFYNIQCPVHSVHSNLLQSSQSVIQLSRLFHRKRWRFFQSFVRYVSIIDFLFLLLCLFFLRLYFFPLNFIWSKCDVKLFSFQMKLSWENTCGYEKFGKNMQVELLGKNMLSFIVIRAKCFGISQLLLFFKLSHYPRISFGKCRSIKNICE